MTIAEATELRRTVTYSEVVTPVDFSPRSWLALSLAGAVARAFGVTNRVVHIDTASPWVDEHAGRLLLKSTPLGRRINVEVVAARTVADGIVRAVRDDTSLVVMSAHARTVAGEIARGSALEDLLRTWPGPVLAVGPKVHSFAPAARRIVLCVAPDAVPPAALVEDVSSMALALRVPVDLLLVRVPSAAIDLDLVQAHQAQVQAVADSMRGAGVRAGIVVLQGARPAREITSYASTHAASVIAMATHARTPAGRFMLGSVAAAVLRQSSAPVLLRRYDGCHRT